MHHPTDRMTHTTAFFTQVMGHWLEREIAQWIHHMKHWSDNPSHHKQGLEREIAQWIHHMKHWSDNPSHHKQGLEREIACIFMKKDKKNVGTDTPTFSTSSSKIRSWRHCSSLIFLTDHSWFRCCFVECRLSSSWEICGTALWKSAFPDITYLPEPIKNKICYRV